MYRSIIVGRNASEILDALCLLSVDDEAEARRLALSARTLAAKSPITIRTWIDDAFHCRTLPQCPSHVVEISAEEVVDSILSARYSHRYFLVSFDDDVNDGRLSTALYAPADSSVDVLLLTLKPLCCRRSTSLTRAVGQHIVFCSRKPVESLQPFLDELLHRSIPHLSVVSGGFKGILQ